MFCGTINYMLKNNYPSLMRIAASFYSESVHCFSRGDGCSEILVLPASICGLLLSWRENPIAWQMRLGEDCSACKEDYGAHGGLQWWTLRGDQRWWNGVLGLRHKGCDFRIECTFLIIVCFDTLVACCGVVLPAHKLLMVGTPRAEVRRLVRKWQSFKEFK